MRNDVALKKFYCKPLQRWGNGYREILNKKRVCFHKMTDNRAMFVDENESIQREKLIMKERKRLLLNSSP